MQIHPRVESDDEQPDSEGQRRGCFVCARSPIPHHHAGCKTARVKISEVADLAAGLKGVRRTASGELMQWRYHGRLVARQLDDAHIVIRAGFDYRDAVVRQFPATFSVPARFVEAHDGCR